MYSSHDISSLLEKQVYKKLNKIFQTIEIQNTFEPDAWDDLTTFVTHNCKAHEVEEKVVDRIYASLIAAALTHQDIPINTLDELIDESISDAEFMNLVIHTTLEISDGKKNISEFRLRQILNKVKEHNSKYLDDDFQKWEKFYLTIVESFNTKETWKLVPELFFSSKTLTDLAMKSNFVSVIPGKYLFNVEKLASFYNNINLNATTMYKSESDFISNNREKLNNFFEIFGADSAALYLNSQLVSSPLPIERFMNSYQLINPDTYNVIKDKFKLMNKQPSKQQIGELAILLSIISVLPKEEQESFIKTVKDTEIKKNDAKKFMSDIRKDCLALYLIQHGVDLRTINFNKIDDKMIQNLIRLEVGIRMLSDLDNKQGTGYKKLLVEMLQADLSKDENYSFENYINNIDNNSQLGRSIAEHNKNCVSELQKGNINTEKAFNYTDTKSIEHKKSSFRVKQWDKNNINTFFLGDYLSCCLATNGEYFDALLERRLDKACLMNVIINEKTQEPVCGNWLFFVKNDKDEIFVIANFFEIRASLSEDEELRDKLVDSLSEFTSKFAQEIGAKGFLIRPLTYGNIPDFGFDKVDKVKMAIEKVGGYFDIKNMSTTNDCVYYFNAQAMNKFYQYRNIVPEKELANEIEVYSAIKKYINFANNTNFEATDDTLQSSLNKNNIHCNAIEKLLNTNPNLSSKHIKKLINENIKNDNLSQAIYAAAKNNYGKVIEFFTNNGIGVLHRAVKEDKPEVVIALLNAGANPMERNRGSQTLFDVVLEQYTTQKMNNDDSMSEASDLIVHHIINANNQPENRHWNYLSTVVQSYMDKIDEYENGNRNYQSNMNSMYLNLVNDIIKKIQKPSTDEMLIILKKLLDDRYYWTRGGRDKETDIIYNTIKVLYKIAAKGSLPNNFDETFMEKFFQRGYGDTLLSVMKSFYTMAIKMENPKLAETILEKKWYVDDEDEEKKLIKNSVLDNNVNLNKPSEQSTSIHQTFLKGPIETVAVLLEDKTINLSEQDDKGLTPLHYAVARAAKDDTKIIELLLAANANFNVKDNNGLTPLKYLIDWGEIEVFKLLLKSKKIDLNMVDGLGLTNLHHAALTNSNSDEFFMLLLKNGADPTKRDIEYMETPLEFVIENDDIDRFKRLFSIQTDHYLDVIKKQQAIGNTHSDTNTIILDLNNLKNKVTNITSQEDAKEIVKNLSELEVRLNAMQQHKAKYKKDMFFQPTSTPTLDKSNVIIRNDNTKHSPRK